MHELSLSSAVVNTVVKHADGRRVEVVNLRIGRLRQVVPDTLDFYFDFVARDTVCELKYEIIEARLRCNPCAEEWGIEIPHFRCPTCGGSDVEVASGNEFEVESIEIGEDRPEGDLAGPQDSEQEEAECIAPR